MSKITQTASVLAFERKLSNSDGLMYSGNWEDREKKETWQPIVIKSKGVRGTISNRLKNKIHSDPAKLDAEIQNPNLQRVDVAALPFDADTLKLQFTLRVLGNLAQPSTCNNSDYQEALAEIINEYVKTTGFRELALRYATNIVNGRTLWRNRIGADNIEIRIKHSTNLSGSSQWVFNSEAYSLRSFSPITGDFLKLVEIIRQGLLGGPLSLLEIEVLARVGKGQEVFPSQELILDKKQGKTLYQVNDIAALHSQKIGNALRTIDDWHPYAEEIGPIAVEPYGSVTNRGKAYRQPKQKMDFFSLLDKWVIKGVVPTLEQQHYVIATMIRGGVFGEKAE